jgi:dipeptide/tripeptide permease
MTAGEPEEPALMVVGVYGSMSYMAMTRSGWFAKRQTGEAA